MKIQDFIKVRHYYCLNRGENPIYFRVIHTKELQSDYINAGVRYIEQFSKYDMFSGDVITIKTTLGGLNISQKDLDKGYVLEMSRESIMKAVMNMTKILYFKDF